MKINPEIFRGYDIRGVVDKDLTPEIVETIGKAHGTYLKSINVSKAVVASDNRLSSDDYRNAVMKGLASTGCEVIDLGMGLSPIMYWAQYHFNSKGGVMVTGSHNPVEYNGFKLARNFSDTLTPVQEIRKLATEEKFVIGGEGKITKAEDYINDYYDDLLSRVNEIKKFKIVVDASNSSSGVFYPELLRRAGSEVIEQNCELDGTFPNGTPDPTEEKVANRLAKRVVEEGADLGFSFDSDGDRLGIVDEKGEVIWNDVLVAIFATGAITQNPGAEIIYNCLCSQVVPRVIEKEGGRPVMWMTGHAFIKAKIQEDNAPFGGELSGHFYFTDRFYPHDDGGYAALRLLESLTKQNKKLSEVVADFPKYISSPEIKVACPDKDKFDVIHDIAKIVKKDFPNEKISEYDNPRQDVYIRVDFKDGMIVLRPSQNGPYQTIKFEAQDEKTYDQRREYILKLLKKYPQIDWSSGTNLEQLK